MSEIELIVFIACIFFACRFVIIWYQPIASIKLLRSNTISKVVLGILPIISLIIISYTLRVLASFDVVTDFIYILFYIFMGYAWIYIAMKLMFFWFDLSWLDDALILNNKAALVAITGGFIGSTILYSGANIGDGPGWWCVIFAAGLGMTSWIVLAVLVHRLTNVFEKMTLERDLACGVRFGCYLLANGLILGKASAGDWTSFSMTVVEFSVGWPALVLTLLVLLVELYYARGTYVLHQNRRLAKEGHDMQSRNSGITTSSLRVSILWGSLYLILALLSLQLYSLPENQIYDLTIARMLGGTIG